MTTHDELDTLATFETQYADNAPTGDGLLRINWYNGEAKLKTPGAFFVSDRSLEALGLAAPGEPWKRCERTFESGDSDTGYEAPALKLMVIGVKQQDCVIGADGKIAQWLEGRVDKAARPQGWSVYVEALVIAQGFDHGPVVWAAKRLKTSMAIVANILPTYTKEVRDPLKKARGLKQRPPLWAFWLPIRGAKDTKGNPIYEPTRGKPVTPPTLILPDGLEGEALARKLFVGAELLRYGEELRGLYADWLEERHVNGAHRNEPQPVEDEDLPF